MATDTVLVSTQPSPKCGWSNAGSRPVPTNFSRQATINVSHTAPTGAAMFSEMHRKKYQPESLLYFPIAYFQNSGFQRIKIVT
jgi:hypothetical protein